MSCTVFLGNLPTWVTADDIKSWLGAEGLVADTIKVIRNPETQESKGFAFIEAPNNEEMQSIIKRFDRAPLEERLLRANPAQPPRGKSAPPVGRPGAAPMTGAPAGAPANRDRRPGVGAGAGAGNNAAGAGKARGPRRGGNTPQSAFAEELAKAL